MSSITIFFIILVLVLSAMLIISVKSHLDFYHNYLQVKIYVFGIKILDIYISIIGLYIRINNSKKLKTINLILDKEQEYLFLQIKQSIIDKLYFDNIKINSLIGIKDASTTAQFVAFLNVFCQIAKNRIVYKNHDISINYENNADFLKKTIIINFGIKVYFTIFDLIFAIILSFYKRSRYVKKRKKSK